MTPFKNWLNLKRETPEAKLLSQSAERFLGEAIPNEKISEVGYLLMKWRNRKGLKNVVVEDYLRHNSLHKLTPHLRNILEMRGVSNFEESCVSAWLLGLLPMEEADKRRSNQTLLRVFSGSKEAESSKAIYRLWRGIWRTIRASFVTSLILAVVGLLTVMSTYFQRGNIPLGFSEIFSLYVVSSLAVGFCTAPMWFALSISHDRRCQTSLNAYCAVSLSRIGLPESTGVLSKACLVGQGGRSIVAQEALCKILPRIELEEFNRIPTETIPNLSKILTKINANSFLLRKANRSVNEIDRAEKFSLVILEIFEKTGDSRALKAVQTISRDGFASSVRTRASEILPILEETARLENDRSFLLRGSDRPLNSHELLMPAYSIPDTKGEELLRPSLGGDRT